jgi:UDP:flavonoid glycosyltransferase YjiC (YdhE family)
MPGVNSARWAVKNKTAKSMSAQEELEREDKIEVSARLAWTGAAISLAPDTPTEAAIRTAVETVSQNPSYRARAKGLQAESQQHDPFDEIARSIDEVAR